MLYTFVLIKHWYMKRLAIIITGMLASLLVASAQSYVRAIVRAIFEMLGLQATDLRNSLNGVSSYKLPISSNVLPAKDNWRIYEPAR